MNITLRPLTADDAEWLDTWLPDVAALVSYPATTVAEILARVAERRTAVASVIVNDNESRGIIVHRSGEPSKNAAIIELVALPRSASRRGLGMAAAALVEDNLRVDGVASVWVSACARNGISVYFWIRLGYRPAMRADWPCAIEGVTWMQRRI